MGRGACKFWSRASDFAALSGNAAFRLKKQLRDPDFTYGGFGRGNGANWRSMQAVLAAKLAPGSELAFDGTGTNWLGAQLMLLRERLEAGLREWRDVRACNGQMQMETETPAGTSSSEFPKALASALEAAGTRGPESSAAGVSAAKRARKVGAAAERDEGEEAECDVHDQAEAEAEAEAAAPDEALDAVDPISAEEQDMRAQAALATFDEVGRVFAALLEAGLTMLYISYARRVNGTLGVLWAGELTRFR
ncbi:hypothetical protein T492DRAFT_901622 [Pavlovales sp. CCMP2436]|nr:hypothetical protein T492DRAFT_901622 [Pavlovales sp. CCMP2436]